MTEDRRTGIDRRQHGDVRCPMCHSTDRESKVTVTRASFAGSVWRRRKCCACSYVFTTYETVATLSRFKLLIQALTHSRDVPSSTSVQI